MRAALTAANLSLAYSRSDFVNLLSLIHRAKANWFSQKGWRMSTERWAQLRLRTGNEMLDGQVSTNLLDAPANAQPDLLRQGFRQGFHRHV